MIGQLFIHQIYYNETTRAGLDAGFIPLDNMANERPDWFEFWPIRQYLKTKTLNEDDYYGFLSPNFSSKLGLGSAQVFDFIKKNHDDAVDAFVFSPCWDQAAFFLNVFEQGNYWHEGLLGLSSEFFHRIHYPTDLLNFVTHSQNTAFCNYVIAKPNFWRRWLDLGEQFFQMVETGTDEFAWRLKERTFYGKNVSQYSMKVFIQERFASFLLASEPFKVMAYDTFSLPGSLPVRDDDYCLKLLACDAYKQAFTKTANPTMKGAYFCQRRRVLEEFKQRVR